MNIIHYRSIPSTRNKFFRTLSDESPRLAYSTADRHKIFNCHAGQRKLFYSEVEFLTKVSRRYDMKEVLVVYAGAATGQHLPVLFSLFPDCFFLLFDPATFKFDGKGFETRFKIINDYFTDESYIHVNKENKRYVAFISDIRTDFDEKNVFTNMIAQQKWVIQLNSIAYMLKFRLPYDQGDYHYQIPEGVDCEQGNGMLYLRGKIYVQIYAQPRSTETRLIHVRRSLNEPFMLKPYDIQTYDEKMNYFNMYIRSRTFKYGKSPLMKKHLLLFDDGYESVTEYYLLSKYLNTKDPTRIIHALYDVDQLLHKHIGNQLMHCIEKTVERNPDSTNVFLQRIHSSLQAQITTMKGLDLLPKEAYTNMMDLGNHLLHKVWTIMKDNVKK